MKPPFLCFHYDIARGTYLKPEVFCEALRLAAASGYTHFLPYLENMIRLPSMERACPSCAYTAEDWMGFEAVAAEVGIELIPHFNAIGHTELIGPAYPELCGGTDGEEHLEMDPTHPAAREWMLRCLGEFCDFSHSRYFLIGGDEWQPPRCLLAQPDFDVAATWAAQVNAAVEFLVQRGRRPIVWHDMLLHYPTARTLLSKQAVIAFWFYDADSDYAALSTFKALGFETLMATAVFDGGLPVVGCRVVEALNCATTAVKAHHADGMIVTTWENCRWEMQSCAIPMAAQVLRGEAPSPEIVEAATLFAAWMKLPPDSPLAREWRTRIETLLAHTVWDCAPAMRRVLRAQLHGDVQDSRDSYAQYHFPLGSGYERAGSLPPPAHWPKRLTHKPERRTFGIAVTHDVERGDVLHFSNAEESFVVYPKYGASLQGWERSGETIIAEGIGVALQRKMPPGGYRSYTSVGGFRPIWAMGAHSNPCILWQYPWEWRIAEQTPDRAAVELTLTLPHGVFSLRIAILCDQSGFAYEARCVNHLEHAFGAFNFNLPMVLEYEDLTAMTLRWNAQGGAHERTLAQAAQSAFWLPARGSLTLDHPTRPVQITASAEQCTGYFVDWNAGWLTPDLHGVYRALQVGEEYVARWHFGCPREGG